MKVKLAIILIILSFGFFNPVLTNAQLNDIYNPFKTKYTVSTVLIQMRDGIHLATDVYYPDSYQQSDQLGSVLIRTPYGKSLGTFLADRFTNKGYMVVIQDIRGTSDSEGTHMVFQNASTDGYDTINWIINQPWSDGRVFTYGGSALGINQFFMHLAHPSGLVAQAIQIATPNLYNDVMYQGGAFRESLTVGWLTAMDSTFWLPDIYQNENFTSIWHNVTLDGKYDQVSTPGFFQAGWYDVFSQGTIDGFLGYKYKSSYSGSLDSHLVIGPWTHGTYNSRTQGDIVFPFNAVEDHYQPIIDSFLDNDMSFGNDSFPAVKYYVMGPDEVNATGNFWRSSDVWPIPVNRTNVYLRNNGQLSLNKPILAKSFQSFLYDPNNPVPTIGGTNLVIEAGPKDQSSLESRDDVLIFSSKVLENNIEITGEISAHLWISSNCTDTDFTVKLTDVYPDGRTILIQDGIVRAKYRNNRTNPELLTPDHIYEIDVDLWSTSYVFNEGHQIRIAISSSNYPRFSVNPNNGAPIFSNNQTYIANNSVHIDNTHPSHISLPIVENGTYPTSTPTTKPFKTISWLEFLSIQIFITLVVVSIRKKKIKL